MKFGSNKPVSEQELTQARACLVLLKKRMATDAPTYFTQNAQPEPSSNYRKVFKPEAKPPISSSPGLAPQGGQLRAPPKKPNNVAIDSSKGFSHYNFEGVEGATPVSQDDRVECPDCGRKFLPESYEKHANVCKKVFMSKRKQFNSAEQRDLDDSALKKKPEPKKPKPGNKEKWKMQSEQFRSIMKAARMASTGDEEAYKEAIKKASDIENSQLKPCPHCDRTFNEEAAKKHIPFCANKARMAQLKNGPPKAAGRGKK